MIETPETLPIPTLLSNSREELLHRYRQVRATTEALCRTLETEDYVVQPMPDASPAKWHLAHTSWFFETFLLKPRQPGYHELNSGYGYLFNSYYVQVGERHCRAQRGLLTRPTVRETYEYRAHVDHAMASFLKTQPEEVDPELESLVTLGLHHEQQHQELLITDVKYLLSVNPLRPAYRLETLSPAVDPGPAAWIPFDGGVVPIGFAGDGFHFDNETPRHRQLLEPFELASRPVTNAEYLEFIDAGGYRTPELWLSDGWAAASNANWEAPLYWEKRDGEWWSFTSAGMRPVDPHEPVCHVSYFEAEAYARWRGCRLPTEAEWEIASAGSSPPGVFLESGRFHPASAPTASHGKPSQMLGNVWEWTASAYLPYPGYRPLPGALGEYNGKFMCNQFVLRGGSCATPESHIRTTYRNFFHPHSRWQFMGLRLAR